MKSSQARWWEVERASQSRRQVQPRHRDQIKESEEANQTLTLLRKRKSRGVQNQAWAWGPRDRHREETVMALLAENYTECIHGVHEALVQSPAPHRLTVEMYICDPSTHKVQMRGSEVLCSAISKV